MDPTAELLDFPAAYGKPSTTLEWSSVEKRIAEAERYWLATTREDGRPHVIPIDGIWLGGAWYFGGAPETVHQRTLADNRNVVMNLEDPMKAVIVEGAAERVRTSPEVATQLAEATKRKYGYPTTPEEYSEVWALRPKLVLAWNSFPTDATRFRFD